MKPASTICLHIAAFGALLLTLLFAAIIFDKAGDPRPLDQWSVRIRGSQIGGYTSNHLDDLWRDYLNDGYSVSSRWKFARVGWFAVSKSGMRPEWHLAMPIYVPALAVAVFPFIWYRQRLCGLYARIIVQRRIARGLCIYCGYDMRESDGTCPECGMAHQPVM